MINQDIIAQDLFYKIRSRFPKMEMGDTDGQPTFEATKGRFFDFDAIFNEHNLGTVSISINEPGSLKIYFSRNILEGADGLVSKTWYEFLKEMRKFAMKRLMSFDTRDISKTNLDKRDYGYLANKESVMSESAMRGTSRTSYKPLQKTKLIIRHSKPVDESIPGARSRNIQALFVENADGERFKYPFPHKVGAECMQRHVANGGLPHDPIGQKIIEMSSDIAKLNSFKKYVYKEDLMNNETNHIVDRANHKLQNLKEMMHKLTKQHHYEAFKHQLECGMMQDRPLLDEITMEEYKDLFTVRSFKEDIADVFPLIHSIMQEANEVDLETLTQGDQATTEELNPVMTPELQFESWADTIVETNMSPEDLGKLQNLLSEPFAVGVQGSNVISTLENLGISIEGNLKQELAELENEQGPDADAKSIVLEFLNTYQPEIYQALDVDESLLSEPLVLKRTDPADDTSRINNPDQSTPTEKAPEEPQASNSTTKATIRTRELPPEFPGAIPKLADPEVEFDEGYFLGPEDLDAWKADAIERVRDGEVDGWTELYSELVSDLGISEKRAELIAKQIYGNQRNPAHYADDSDEVDDLDTLDDPDDDDAFLSNLRGDIGKHGKIGFEVDEEDKLHVPDSDTDEPEVQRAHEPKGHDPKEIAKFIMGFYDKETGHFPLGETGVLIKVEKQFGKKAARLARRLIRSLASRGERDEFEDLRVLSGQRPAKLHDTMATPVMARPAMETADFASILKLAGLK